MVGVACDDEAGVVAVQALLDPLLWRFVHRKGVLVLGGADVPAGVGVARRDRAVGRQALGVGTDDGGVQGGRAVPAALQQGVGVEEGHGKDPVDDPQHERAPAGEFLGVGLGKEAGGELAVKAVVLGQW
ncbi:hypothetical protein [Streptomyces sp. WMMC905]|uniref:hypothetical protein n=1 Tax=Streptomyces sp. WMMC905 TaxID=3404123 RepID=UPI003B9624B7